MSATFDFDNACLWTPIPAEDEFLHWINIAQQYMTATNKPVNVGIRIVDELESALLNHEYRGKDYATNVLSFSSELPQAVLAELDEIPLGDLAICASVVEREAVEQQKLAKAHWAHMVVHGVLHLNGYDHEVDEAAEEMETLERKILAALDIPDPYQVEN